MHEDKAGKTPEEQAQDKTVQAALQTQDTSEPAPQIPTEDPAPEGAPPAAEEEKVDEKPREEFDTAFLVVRRPNGGIEAVINIPGVPIKRPATLQDIVSMCAYVQGEGLAIVGAREVRRELAQAAMLAAAQKAKKPGIVVPGPGALPGGLRRG